MKKIPHGETVRDLFWCGKWDSNPRHLEAGCKGGREAKADKRKVPADLHLQGLKNLGWEMGLEPTTTGITIRDSTN